MFVSMEDWPSPTIPKRILWQANWPTTNLQRSDPPYSLAKLIFGQCSQKATHGHLAFGCRICIKPPLGNPVRRARFPLELPLVSRINLIFSLSAWTCHRLSSPISVGLLLSGKVSEPRVIQHARPIVTLTWGKMTKKNAWPIVGGARGGGRGGGTPKPWNPCSDNSTLGVMEKI